VVRETGRDPTGIYGFKKRFKYEVYILGFYLLPPNGFQIFNVYFDFRARIVKQVEIVLSACLAIFQLR
jgi:hypothetical protein